MKETTEINEDKNVGAMINKDQRTIDLDDYMIPIFKLSQSVTPSTRLLKFKFTGIGVDEVHIQ